VKLTTLRLLGILVAVLVLGAVALTVAWGVQAPRASQIPTVVTSEPTATPVVQSIAPTPSPAPAVTKPVVPKPTSAKTSSSGTTSHATTKSSDREVVTPKMRDDGDGDESGPSKGDGDSDDQGSSGTSQKSSSGGSSSASKSSSDKATPITSTKSSEIKTVTSGQSRREPDTGGIAAPTHVQRDHSSGKNVQGGLN
jgi:hypothetical protein